MCINLQIRHKVKLGAEVAINDLGIRPFNRATMRVVTMVCAGFYMGTYFCRLKKCR